MTYHYYTSNIWRWLEGNIGVHLDTNFFFFLQTFLLLVIKIGLLNVNWLFKVLLLIIPLRAFGGIVFQMLLRMISIEIC